MNQEKKNIKAIITPHLDTSILNENETKRKRTELVDFAKFIVTSRLDIQILPTSYTIPDLLVKWNGELYAVEHTAIIDQTKKLKAEKTDNLIRKAQLKFVEKFGALSFHVRFSLKFEVTEIYPKDKNKFLQHLLNNYGDLGWSEAKLMANAYAGYFTPDDIERVSSELADNAYRGILNPNEAIESDYINHLSVSTAKSLLFTRNAAWSAGAIDEPVMDAIRDKEKHIEKYRRNSKGLKQCLFLVVHGSNAYSDYASFDQTILHNKDTPFDKVIFFNFFTGEYFILK